MLNFVDFDCHIVNLIDVGMNPRLPRFWEAMRLYVKTFAGPGLRPPLMERLRRKRAEALKHG